MHQQPTKICANCGAEYSAEAFACADCGGTLLFPEQLAHRAVPLGEAEAKVLLREESAAYLQELSGLLAKGGIRSAIRFHGCAPGT